ncbi:MAG TPA: TIGR02996 domain-containing protein, partial [Gemmataceae bacterium]|nr:TIGR02996 domain-containing protein [Gemmataceae bacterium]
MTDVDALLQAIHDNPDEDGPRLAYSDWLEEHGDAADRIRAEFIRLQCELARQGADAPQALSDRVEELLAAHREEWTTLAFARWLQHPKKSCGNTQGHDFCKLVSQGIRAAHERDRLPAGDPRRAYRERRLDQLERRMEDEYDYFGCTCSAPLFDEAEFRRGFVEKVTVQDYAVILYADALPDLGVIRELEI